MLENNYCSIWSCFSIVDVQQVFDAFVSVGQLVMNQSADVAAMLSDPEHVLWAIGALIYRPDIMQQVFCINFVFTSSLLEFYNLHYLSRGSNEFDLADELCVDN
jgi:hypothetical protein